MRWCPKVCLLALALLLAVPASGGASTVAETIRLGPAKSGLRQLLAAPGQGHMVRRAAGARIRRRRWRQRRLTPRLAAPAPEWAGAGGALPR